MESIIQLVSIKDAVFGSMYTVSLILCFIIFFIDWNLKGRKAWKDNSEFEKGWSWHLLWFGVYAIFIYLNAQGLKWYYLIFIINYITEDAFYYLWKSYKTKKLLYNSWFPTKKKPFFKGTSGYYLFVITVNLFLIIITMQWG